MLFKREKNLVEINEVGWSFPTEKLYNIDMALEFKRAWLMWAI